MPRSRGGGGGRRPMAPPARPQPPAPQQTRPASTAAQPQARPGPQQQQQQQGQGQQRPGLFGQMASTAAGVAVGSSIGHAIGGFFGGGAQEQQPQQPYDQQASYDQQQPQQAQTYNTQYGGGSCEVDAKNFTQCLDQNGGNMQICGWYLEQLKACQAASAQWGK